MPDFAYENKFEGIVAGVDEAGRGPWAGPVVAAAVVLDKNNYPSSINDSKKLSSLKREYLYKLILNSAKVAVGISTVEEIDDLNILEATKLAMVRAVDSLGLELSMVLIDGNGKHNLRFPVTTIVKGDSLSLSIAAASIIAKVTRDKIMNDLHGDYPYYGWQNNSGYGTKLHMESINKFGITIHHRRSFAPIKKIIANQS